jgi:hypothetical protein
MVKGGLLILVRIRQNQAQGFAALKLLPVVGKDLAVRMVFPHRNAEFCEELQGLGRSVRVRWLYFRLLDCTPMVRGSMNRT